MTTGTDVGRTPPLIPQLKLARRVVESDLGPMISSFHVHTVDESLEQDYTEATVATAFGRPVRVIRSHPERPIADGAKTAPGHIDHFGIDFLAEPLPSVDSFDTLKALYPDAKLVMQDQPHCGGIRVERKIWVYADGYPPMEIQLGPKSSVEAACHPRPAWPEG
ncbi:MAG: hypothetical protein RID91_17675 [Azospirillaceae bacterium]